MGLTNAEKQKRWREKRNSRADALTGTPKEIVNGILRVLGPGQANTILRELEGRLRNLRSDCPACHGAGFVRHDIYTACGVLLSFRAILPCDCADGAPASAA
jgi:hypothetical protein